MKIVRFVCNNESWSFTNLSEDNIGHFHFEVETFKMRGARKKSLKIRLCFPQCTKVKQQVSTINCFNGMRLRDFFISE